MYNIKARFWKLSSDLSSIGWYTLRSNIFDILKDQLIGVDDGIQFVGFYKPTCFKQYGWNSIIK